MKVLVIGGGGREHVLTWKLSQSPRIDKIYCAPGNGGTAAIAENLSLDSKDLQALADFAEEERIDLTVVGPETYLALGTVDLFYERGLKVFGPTKAAAKLEWSKVFAKQFMQKYHIPTAASQTFTHPEQAKEYIRSHDVPLVIKADGLAAGKGVVIAQDTATAIQAVDDLMEAKIFGSAGASIVIEEYLEGEEVSLLAFCDGKIAVPMLPAQDHKRIGEGDTGPNTGGMGNYAPTTAVTPALMKRIVTEILDPTMRAMAAEGHPFVGVLFLGLMLTATGPKLIEYNVRFGDPEAQVVLPLLQSDLADIMLAAVDGQLNPAAIRFETQKTAVCVVATSGGYPGAYATGKVITGLDRVNDATLVFHAGTRKRADGALLTDGGRVLNLVYLGDTIETAILGAYRQLQKITFDGMYYRKDIAKRELERYKNSNL